MPCSILIHLAVMLPLVAFVLAAKANEAYAAASVPAGFVGSEKCRACHDEEYASIAGSPHKKLLEASQPEKQGCEACHGPGQAHMDGNGDASKIFRFTGARTLTVRARCGTCHKDLSDATHSRQQDSCLSCHSAHHAQEKELLLKGDAGQ
ncbi:MAG TPA: hypothetical protein VH437_07375 [Terriglobales bacterium]